MYIILQFIYFIIKVEAVFYGLFILSCLFKKTCKWKMCPFRSKNDRDLNIFKCTKCHYPFDDEEEAEMEKMCDRLEELIKQLSHENGDN